MNPNIKLITTLAILLGLSMLTGCRMQVHGQDASNSRFIVGGQAGGGIGNGLVYESADGWRVQLPEGTEIVENNGEVTFIMPSDRSSTLTFRTVASLSALSYQALKEALTAVDSQFSTSSCEYKKVGGLTGFSCRSQISEDRSLMSTQFGFGVKDPKDPTRFNVIHAVVYSSINKTELYKILDSLEATVDGTTIHFRDWTPTSH